MGAQWDPLPWSADLGDGYRKGGRRKSRVESTGWPVLKARYSISIFPALEAPSQALRPCILTIVWIGLHSAESQVLAEERHGGVLRLGTLGGHGAACWLE